MSSGAKKIYLGQNNFFFPQELFFLAQISFSCSKKKSLKRKYLAARKTSFYH